MLAKYLLIISSPLASKAVYFSDSRSDAGEGSDGTS